jgi:hypothetical protein
VQWQHRADPASSGLHAGNLVASFTALFRPLHSTGVAHCRSTCAHPQFDARIVIHSEETEFNQVITGV